MTTYYHVAKDWDGEAIESLYDQYGDEAYDIYAEKWPEAGELAQYHAHVVHLYADRKQAEEHADTFGGDVLVIDDQDDELEITIDTLEFGHPVCNHEIDACYVRKA